MSAIRVTRKKKIYIYIYIHIFAVCFLSLSGRHVSFFLGEGVRCETLH